MGTSNAPATFAELLQTAVTEPGLIASAYSNFHNYSFGNVLLAAFQCGKRGIPLGPLATFPRWKELGRHVKRGEKAITLCQPITVPREARDQGADGAGGTGDAAGVVVRFVFRPKWFVLMQTEGAELPPVEIPAWDKVRALAALDVTEIEFSAINGNVMGFARKREVAVSPLSPLPIKTLFHEVAHVLLGHTSEREQADSEATPRNLSEAEAEAVALLCLEALGLPGAEYCRGYIQHWTGAGNAIPERSAQKVLRVADQILRAGRADAEVSA